MIRALKPLLGIAALFAGAIHLQAGYQIQVNSSHFAAGGGGQFNAKLFTNNANPQNIVVSCVDYLNYFNYGNGTNSQGVPNNSWNVNLSSITSGSNISNTRFGTWESTYGGTPDFDPVSTGNGAVNAGINALTALQRYQMAAWLTTQYGTNGMLPNSNDAKGIQGAIWRLLNPVDTSATGGDPSSGPDSPNYVNSYSNTWLIAAWNARANLTDAFYSRFRVITQSPLGTSNPFNGSGTDLRKYQEFITEIPEPGHLALLAICLGGLFWFRRRRAANLTV